MLKGTSILGLNKDTPYIWTADEYTRTDTGAASNAWVVYFDFGYCSFNHVDSSNHVDYSNYVRAVR